MEKWDFLNDTHRRKSFVVSDTESVSQTENYIVLLCSVAGNAAPSMPRKAYWRDKSLFFSTWRIWLYVTILFKKESVYASYLAGNVTIRQCRRWEGGEKWYLYAEYTGCMLCCQPQCKIQISEIARLKTYAVEMRQLKGLI